MDNQEKVRQADMLHAVSEQLKQSLVYIRNAAELADIQSTPVDTKNLHSSAINGLLLIEYFQTWQQYATGRSQQCSQVNLAAVLHAVQERLLPIAKQQQVQLELHAAGRYAPVHEDVRLIEAGIGSLGIAFMQAAQINNSGRVVLNVHKTRWGIVAGVYSPDITVRADALRAMRGLVGHTKQLLPNSSPSAMSGVAIADGLLALLDDTKLRPSRFRGLSGLAVTLKPSPQLTLI